MTHRSTAISEAVPPPPRRLHVQRDRLPSLPIELASRVLATLDGWELLRTYHLPTSPTQ